MKKYLQLLLLGALLVPLGARAQGSDCTPVVVTAEQAFEEGFEPATAGATELPACWSYSGDVIYTPWQIGVGDYSTTTGTHSGSGNLKIRHNAKNSVSTLTSPVLDLSGLPSALLSFWYINRIWSPDIDELEVLYRTDTTNGTEWTVLAHYTTATAVWTEAYFTLPALSATCQVAFRYTSKTGYGVGIDDLRIGMPPSCYPVRRIYASDFTTEGMTIHWEDDDRNDETTTYTLSYTGGSDNTVVRSGLTGNSIVLTGLQSMTRYSFAILPECNDGSLNAATCTGTTLCGGVTCNLTFEMRDQYTDGWNGGTFLISQLGCEMGSVTLSSGDSNRTEFVSVCEGFPVNVIYSNASSYPREMRGRIFDGRNELMYTINDPLAPSDSIRYHVAGDTLVTFMPNCPACMQPIVTVDSIGPDFIDVIWQSNASQYAVYLNDSLVNDMVVENFYHFENVNENTLYTIGVRGFCSATDSSFLGTVTAHTNCFDINTLPFEENFDEWGRGALAEFHYCWSKGNNLSSSSYPYVNLSRNAGVSMTTNVLDFTISYENQNAKVWAVMPTIGDQVELNTVELSFKGSPGTSSGNNSHNMLVGVINTPVYDGTSPIDTVAILKVNEEKSYYVSFANYEGQGKHIILLSFLNPSTSYSYGYVYVDNVSLHPIPDCPRPDSLTAEAGTSTLDLAWTADESANNFLIEWRPADSANAEYESGISSTTSYTIEGLQPGTRYRVQVRTLCGNDTSTMEFKNFRTNCTTVTEFPWTEDFEGESVACWTSTGYNSSSSDDWTISTSKSHSGAQSIFSNYSSSSPGANWLVSSPIMLGEDMDSTFLSWYIYGGATSILRPRYAVKVSTTSATDTSAFTTLLEEERDDASSIFVKRRVGLSAYKGNTIYLAFVRYAANDWGLYLDDIKIEQILAPVASISGPANPMAGMQSTYTVAVTDGVNEGITYQWRSSRADAGSVAPLRPSNNAQVNITYYTSGVDTLSCVVCNAFGCDTAYYLVRPMDIPHGTLPYTTGFEPNEDRDWTIVNGRASNAWYIDTAAHASGSYALYVSNDNGLHNTYTISAAMVGDTAYSSTFAYKPFYFDHAGEYHISLDWRCKGESNTYSTYDYARIHIVPISDTNMIASRVYRNYPSWPIVATLSGSSLWQSSDYVFTLDAPGLYYVCFRWTNDGSVGDNPPAAVDNIHIAPYTCPPPTDIVIDETTTSTVTMHWNPGGNESSWQLQVGDLAPVTVNDTFYTASGLQPSTNYTVKVRGICGDDDVSGYAAQTFWTECASFQVPYVIPFSATTLNNCWGNQYNGSTEPYDTWSESASSTYTRYIYSQAPTDNAPISDYLISPAIEIPATDTLSLRLLYNVRGDTSTYYDGSVAAYQLLVSPTGSKRLEDFTEVMFVDTLASGLFEERSFPVSNYAGQTIRFAFRCISKRQGKVSLSDFEVRYTNMPVFNVRGVSSVMAEERASFKAVYQEGDLSTMQYTWISSMASNGRASMEGEESDSLNIYYHQAGTDTLIFVGHNAFGADTTVMYVRVFQCGTISSFPYHEDFEILNPCWTMVYGDNDPSVNPMIVTDDLQNQSGQNLPAHDGSNAFRFSSYSSSTNYNQYLITPEINGHNLVLEFWASRRNAEDSLWIGYSTTTNDVDAFAWNDAVVLADASQWNHIEDTIPDGVKYVAFRYYGPYRYYYNIDDLTISRTDACMTPVVNSLTSDETSITVSFLTEASQVEVAIVEGDLFNDDVHTELVSGNSYTFTGLNHSTRYTVAIRGVCADDNVSDWEVLHMNTVYINCGVPTNLSVDSTSFDAATISWQTNGTNEQIWEMHVFNTEYDSTFVVECNPYTISGLLTNVQYKVIVRALCGSTHSVYGDWSDTLTFTTDVCHPASSIIVVGITDTTARVRWNDSVPGSGWFKIEYGEVGFLRGEGKVDSVQGNTYVLTGLQCNTDYDVLVANMCSSSILAWGNKRTFQTDTCHTPVPPDSDIVVRPVDRNSISLYPNPASSTVTVDGLEGQVEVSVVDMNGRTVTSISTQDSHVNIDLSDMARGAYFVRVVGEQRNAIRKLIVR